MTDKIRTDLSESLGPAGSVTFKNPSALDLDRVDRRPGLPVLALLLVTVLLLAFAWSEGREDSGASPSAGEVVQTR
jgi:hypothetical protein